MATSWPTTDPVTSATLARTHFDGGGANAQAVTEGRISALLDRDEVLIRQPFSVYFSSQTSTSATYETKWTGTFVLTPATVGKTLSLTIYAYNSSAGSMQWKAFVGANSGESASVTSTSATNESTVTLTLPGMTNLLDQELVTFYLQVKRVSGSGNATIVGTQDSLSYVSD